MDYLIMGCFLLDKKEQKPLKERYKVAGGV